ncbi:hypothetical protein AVEN_159381-1 [Araneus ventricosus]|uniref:Uncharacterized protein n=1 Tax=Araneus ventricosus TaxID=182803 RepID=A0A4Y2A258_ARAVE|nr:hypothetical protein AVEN_159381-1 [Araneus ventricosus]
MLHRSEALVTSTRKHKLKIFEALPPQFLFREQWLLVESLLSHGSGVSPFQDHISSGGTGFRAVVSNSGSGNFLSSPSGEDYQNLLTIVNDYANLHHIATELPMNVLQ